jgi:hypothetical protein
MRQEETEVAARDYEGSEADHDVDDERSGKGPSVGVEHVEEEDRRGQVHGAAIAEREGAVKLGSCVADKPAQRRKRSQTPNTGGRASRSRRPRSATPSGRAKSGQTNASTPSNHQSGTLRKTVGRYHLNGTRRAAAGVLGASAATATSETSSEPVGRGHDRVRLGRPVGVDDHGGPVLGGDLRELVQICPQNGQRVSHEHCGRVMVLPGGVSRAALPQIVPVMSIRPWGAGMMVLFEGTINRPNGPAVGNSAQERASALGFLRPFHHRRRPSLRAVAA